MSRRWTELFVLFHRFGRRLARANGRLGTFRHIISHIGKAPQNRRSRLYIDLSLLSTTNMVPDSLYIDSFLYQAPLLEDILWHIPHLPNIIEHYKLCSRFCLSMLHIQNYTRYIRQPQHPNIDHLDISVRIYRHLNLSIRSDPHTRCRNLPALDIRHIPGCMASISNHHQNKSLSFHVDIYLRMHFRTNMYYAIHHSSSTLMVKAHMFYNKNHSPHPHSHLAQFQ